MVSRNSKHLARPSWQGGWAVAIFISDNPAPAEVCLISSPTKLALNVIFPWGKVPDLPKPESHITRKE
jgi:hypothetical protein